jgi:S1-C subfamily serine protease
MCYTAEQEDSLVLMAPLGVMTTPVDAGLLVETIVPGFVASYVGIVKGDIITEINGQLTIMPNVIGNALYYKYVPNNKYILSLAWTQKSDGKEKRTTINTPLMERDSYLEYLKNYIKQSEQRDP